MTFNTLQMYDFSFQGHEKEALNLMSTYLPKDSSPGSAYSEGGGLYALGKILFCSANCGQ